MANKSIERDNPLWKVIVTDAAGIGCLILVPIVGPWPGPGGIPLLVAGLGFLGQNHEWARKWMYYVKKHSTSVREIVFPNTTWIKWAWDITALAIMSAGIWGSFAFDDNRLFKVFSIGVMASASTIFMLNRNRIDVLEKWFHRNQKQN